MVLWWWEEIVLGLVRDPCTVQQRCMRECRAKACAQCSMHPISFIFILHALTTLNGQKSNKHSYINAFIYRCYLCYQGGWCKILSHVIRWTLMLSHFLPISSFKLFVKPSLGALTKSSRTVAYSAVSYAPVVHAFVPLVVPHSFASSRVRGISGEGLGGSFRGALPGGTGRGFSLSLIHIWRCRRS